MILLIDNYDSFTFNLVQVLQVLGHHPLVLRNDQPELSERITDPELKALILSPGPGRPENAGMCLELLTCLPAQIPVLGVCLGHQALACYAGSKVNTGTRIMHGKTSEVMHDGSPLFAGISSPFTACRYHSLLAEDIPGIEVIANTEEGEIMALKLPDRPWYGVQFHPESILTPDGPRIMDNFFAMHGIKKNKEELCA
ncbi:MAG: anthranilate synthase component II [Desulfonatronovibrionaceae bacterium]